LRAGYSVTTEMKQKDFRPLGLVMQVGFTVVGAILLGLFVGMGIDNLLQSWPFGVLFCTVLGAVAGSVGVYRLAIAAMKQAAKEKSDKEGS
jgi:F0F1-type ATP synthase assembly protein I